VLVSGHDIRPRVPYVVSMLPPTRTNACAVHGQGIIHRDIKPDNCLVTQDDVLKIVDFGVSEMFDKEGEMKTAKSAGSPAFMPPELCVAKHGEVSGKAADVWSMGCTLFCLLFGRIPFEKHGMLELYQAIRNDEPVFDDGCNPELVDLLKRLLEKNPEKRITTDEIRVSTACMLSPSANTDKVRNIPGSLSTEPTLYYPSRKMSRSSSSLQPTKRSTLLLLAIWAT
jgi:serine/threonine protein kinase